MCAQIGSFREVLSKQSIGVLVRSALPRAVRFAEVDGKAGCDPKIRMPGHLCSLVPGQRAAKLRWQCRDRPGDGIANRFSPMTGKRRPVLYATTDSDHDGPIFPNLAKDVTAECPSRAKAGGQLTTECAAALYVERLIDRLMTDPHRLILGPSPG